MNHKNSKNRNKNLPSVFTRLILFIGLVLFIQFISVFTTIHNKNIIKSKATDTNCPDPIGTEKYDPYILALGPHIAGNNSPENYKLIRKIYNCQNNSNPPVKKNFVPITVMYDLFFLKSNVQNIKNNLEEMKKYGLYPIIRVVSYTGNLPGCTNECWVKLYDTNKINEDVTIMGSNLASALNSVTGFPDKPTVIFLNEINLHSEWQGKADGKEFAKSFSEFYDAMKTGNFYLFLPPLSYGVDGNNGILPAKFLEDFFATNRFSETKYINGMGFNIYGTSYQNIVDQFNQQMSTLDPYRKYFYKDMGKVIVELGPVVRGSALYDCMNNKAEWENSAQSIVAQYANNPPAIATIACFGDKTYPGIAHYDGTISPLITLPNYGQIIETETTTNAQTNSTNTNTNTTTNITTQNPEPTPTAQPSKVSTTLNLKLKFQGIIKKPVSKNNTITVNVGIDNTNLRKSAVFAPDANGLYSGSIIFNLTPGNYSIGIKGNKHLQKIICDQSPTETMKGTYTCSTQSRGIGIKSGINNIDFSGITFLAGDLDQNKIINNDDLSIIRNRLGKKDTDSLQKADVNLDGIVDTQDWSLVLATLSITNADEEYAVDTTSSN